MGYISKLYAIEQELRDGSDAERYRGAAVTQRALLAEFKIWLEDQIGKSSPMKGSLTRKAMGTRWDSGLAWWLLHARRSAPRPRRDRPVF